jgi:chemotaxis protein methyltransferase CheR
MMDDAEEFRILSAKIARDRGFSCASYKERCLRRRIAVRMRARGTHTFDDYAALLDRDPEEYDKLLDALTINVTKFFRNWDAWAALERHVVTPLLQSPPPSVNVWSAGCASGEEPYSLAALFHHTASSLDRTVIARRVHVLGTDIDAASLLAAEQGHFEARDFAETPPELRDRYFLPHPPFSPVPAIREMVRFRRFDLLSDRALEGGFHLIVCRNVLIYFDRDTQERLFDTFYHALAPGGALMLGKVETLLGAARQRFDVLDSRERIFARPR